MRTRTMLRRLKSVPLIIDREYPYAGRCVFCDSPDSRHRIFDTLVGRVRAGESRSSVAHDMGVSPYLVKTLVEWWRE